MKRLIFILLLLVCSLGINAAVLITPEYKFEITMLCEEGNVTCDKANLIVYNLSDDSIKDKANGRTKHSLCTDNKTPCRFLGYEFTSGFVTYNIYQSGKVEAYLDQKEEPFYLAQGAWK